MWVWIVAAIVLFVVIAATTSAVHALRRRRGQYAEAISLWCKTPAEERLAALSTLPAEDLPNAPAWFLIGCAHLHAYQNKQAARAFGMAHHADCNLETAALLTFACLKADEGEDSNVIEQIITTWQEMKRPDILRQRPDRQMLDCLASTVGRPPEGSPLGRLAWLVVGPALRPKARQLFEADDPGKPASGA